MALLELDRKGLRQEPNPTPEDAHALKERHRQTVAKRATLLRATWPLWFKIVFPLLLFVIAYLLLAVLQRAPDGYRPGEVISKFYSDITKGYINDTAQVKLKYEAAAAEQKTYYEKQLKQSEAEKEMQVKAAESQAQQEVARMQAQMEILKKHYETSYEIAKIYSQTTAQLAAKMADAQMTLALNQQDGRNGVIGLLDLGTVAASLFQKPELAQSFQDQRETLANASQKNVADAAQRAYQSIAGMNLMTNLPPPTALFGQLPKMPGPVVAPTNQIQNSQPSPTQVSPYVKP